MLPCLALFANFCSFNRSSFGLLVLFLFIVKSSLQIRDTKMLVCNKNCEYVSHLFIYDLLTAFGLRLDFV